MYYNVTEIVANGKYHNQRSTQPEMARKLKAFGRNQFISNFDVHLK